MEEIAITSPPIHPPGMRAELYVKLKEETWLK